MTFLRRLPVVFSLFVTASSLSAETPEESFDRIIPALRAKWNVPGGAVAVVRNGRLVFAKGYGLSNREAGQSVQASSLFRIASVSKPITAVAILKLAEEGRLDLDARAADGRHDHPLHDGPAAAVHAGNGVRGLEFRLRRSGKTHR